MPPSAKSRFLRLAASASLVLALFCWPALAFSETLRPNVIFVVVDTLRADHCSYAGYQRNTTPNMDSLALDSTVFLNAESAAPWTLPSYASMLSGKQAFNHDFNAPTPGLQLTGTVAEPFNQLGYDTYSIQTNFFLAQLDSEFKHHSWYMEPADFSTSAYSDGKAGDQAVSYLENRGSGENYFLFMGLFSPHAKYYPHTSYINDYFNDALFRSTPRQSVTGRVAEPFLLRASDMAKGTAIPDPVLSYYDDTRIYAASYDSEISYSDEQLGKLLDTLKANNLYDESLIIVTSDHGETLADGRRFFTHGTTLEQRETHVPLLVKLPYQNEQKVVDDYVSALDIFPTVFDYMNLEVAGQEGTSLLPLIYQEGQSGRRDVISYLLEGNAQNYSIIENGYKLIKSTRADLPAQYRLYDLKTDPNETQDLSLLHPELVQTMDAYLSSKTGNR